jgi:hypothetical protein
VKKSDIFPSRYLKGAEIEGREITVVIENWKMEDVGGDEDKLVIRFQGATKGLVCNATNFDRIAYINGSDDTKDWPGTEVVLYTELATFQGRTAPAVRIKAPLKKQNGGPQIGENRANYDAMRKTEPVRNTDADLADDREVPF